MLRQLFRQSVVGLSFAALAGTAIGQVSVFKESTLNPTEVAVEVKPLPLAMSFLPGMSSVGAGAELSAGGQAATFVNGYLINSDLPNGMRSTDREKDLPVIQKLEGYAVDVGARYYSRIPGADSWYGGGKVGYSAAKGQWGYKDEQVESLTRTVTPGVEAGYRWAWANRMLFRLGAGADANILQENETGPLNNSTEVTLDAEDKIQGYAQVAVLPRVDLGLGYTF